MAATSGWRRPRSRVAVRAYRTGPGGRRTWRTGNGSVVRISDAASAATSPQSVNARSGVQRRRGAIQIRQREAQSARSQGDSTEVGASLAAALCACSEAPEGPRQSRDT